MTTRAGKPPSTRFARHCAKRGIRAEALAVATANTVWSVYHWLAGRRVPSGPSMRLLAEYLGASVESTRKLFKED